MTAQPDAARVDDAEPEDDWLGAVVPTAMLPADDPETTEDVVETVIAAPDQDYADRLMWRARRLEAERDGVEAFFTQRVTEIKDWRERRLRAIGHEAERIRQSLELFARRALADHPKRKSIPLPNGTLKLTAPGKGRVEVTHPADLTDFCEAHGLTHLLRYKPEANKTAIAELESLVPRPQAIVEGPDGQPEAWKTWAYLVTVRAEDEEGADAGEEIVTLPGVRYMERAEDRFAVKLAGDEPGDEEL